MQKLIVLFCIIAAISGEVVENNAEGITENGNQKNLSEQRSSFQASLNSQQQSDCGLSSNTGGTSSSNTGGTSSSNTGGTSSSNGGIIPTQSNGFYNYFQSSPYNGLNSQSSGINKFSTNNGLTSTFLNGVNNPSFSSSKNGLNPSYLNGYNNPSNVPPNNAINPSYLNAINIPANISPNNGINPSFLNGINDPSSFSPINGANPSNFNGINNPFKFPPSNGANPSYLNGFYNSLNISPYNNGRFPPPYNSPYFHFSNPHSPYIGGVTHVAGTGYCTCPPGLFNNHFEDSHLLLGAAHINHKPEIISTVSEKISEILPHGEQVVKETETFSGNIHGDSHFHHEPVVTNSVSHVISEILPHGGEVVKETKEFTTHTEHENHGHGYGHHKGGY